MLLERTRRHHPGPRAASHHRIELHAGEAMVEPAWRLAHRRRPRARPGPLRHARARHRAPPPLTPFRSGSTAVRGRDMTGTRRAAGGGTGPGPSSQFGRRTAARGRPSLHSTAWRRRSGPTTTTGRSSIPLDTPHPRPAAMAAHGFVQLRDLADVGARGRVPRARVHGLEERRRHELRADRDRRRRARLPRVLEQGERAPRQGRDLHRRTPSSARRCVAGSRTSARTSGGSARSSSSPRATTTRSAPSTATTTTASTPTTRVGSCAPGSSSPTTPTATCSSWSAAPTGSPDPATEIRVPLHRGAQFVVDTQRLWHVVVHTGPAPRYALISSFEIEPAARRLDRRLRCPSSPGGRRSDRDAPIPVGSSRMGRIDRRGFLRAGAGAAALAGLAACSTRGASESAHRRAPGR